MSGLRREQHRLHDHHLVLLVHHLLQTLLFLEIRLVRGLAGLRRVPGMVLVNRVPGSR